MVVCGRGGSVVVCVGCKTAFWRCRARTLTGLMSGGASSSYDDADARVGSWSELAAAVEGLL